MQGRDGISKQWMCAIYKPFRQESRDKNQKLHPQPSCESCGQYQYPKQLKLCTRWHITVRDQCQQCMNTKQIKIIGATQAKPVQKENACSSEIHTGCIATTKTLKRANAPASCTGNLIHMNHNIPMNSHSFSEEHESACIPAAGAGCNFLENMQVPPLEWTRGMTVLRLLRDQPRLVDRPMPATKLSWQARSHHQHPQSCHGHHQKSAAGAHLARGTR